MTGKYKNEDIRDYFNVSHETVRRYAIDFAEFFSDGAAPDKPGQHRVYNDSDLRVFAVIVSMKNSNHSDDDIKATLRAGSSGDLSSLLDDETVTLSPHIQNQLVRQEVDNLRQQLASAADEAQVWRDKAMKLEGQLEQLQKQMEQQSNGQTNQIELHKEIARLTVLLEIEKQKSQKDDS
jgi:DNA-binding transcriptional MerR regulator